MRKYLFYANFFMTLALLMFSCSTGNRIKTAQREAKANIRQLTREDKKEKDTIVLPKHITYVDDKGVTQTIHTAELDTNTGEYITSIQLTEVVIRSKAKSIPERNGQISLDFFVDVPKALQKTDWKLIFIPILNNGGDIKRLDSICIKGSEWEFIDERKAYHKNRRMENRLKMAQRLKDRVGQHFTGEYRDSVITAETRKLDRFSDSMRNLMGGIRLDTVIRRKNALQYHYSHIFQTNDMATTLRMSFEGYVEDMNNNRFRLAEGDTLTFLISSMMHFLDRSPRYKRKIVHRRVTESLTADIQFLVGRTDVVDSLGNNAAEMDRIRMKMDEINHGNEFVIDSVVMVASCSPEGSVTANAALAKGRAEGLKMKLKDIIESNAVAMDELKVHSVAEDWEGVQQCLRKANDIVHVNNILDLIENTPDLDEREAKIKTAYPEDYQKIKDNIYPLVRHVDFQFYLARRNMVEDVMFTDVIDEEYADAIALMDRRKYKEAMEKLTEYDDWNSAICLMSLGYNQRAYEIFSQQPETADREYLMSILLSRMGKTQQAVDLFLKSCRMDYSKIDRGELDPEISKLIKQYKLDEIVGW